MVFYLFREILPKYEPQTIFAWSICSDHHYIWDIQLSSTTSSFLKISRNVYRHMSNGILPLISSWLYNCSFEMCYVFDIKSTVLCLTFYSSRGCLCRAHQLALNEKCSPRSTPHSLWIQYLFNMQVGGRKCQITELFEPPPERIM